MSGVTGRVALVTGAGSAEGIGFATAKLLQSAGARVAITSTTERIHDRRRELGGDDKGCFCGCCRFDGCASGNGFMRARK